MKMTFGHFQGIGVGMEELESLVVRAQGGDVNAFGEIVRRFQDMALGYAYSIIGAFDSAEDAVQEAFVAAWSDLPSLQHPAAFPGWFKRVVFKHCDRLTRRKKVPILPLSEIAEIPSDAPELLVSASQADLRAKVLEAVRALPADERTVTTLFYINGYSQSDISQFLEVPVTTVNNRLHSSRKRLKERMLEMFSDELKDHTLSEEFPERVKMLLNLPRPLEIKGHPIRELWKVLCSCFPDFEVIELDEIVPRRTSPIPLEAMARHVHSVDEERILRPEITSQLVERWLSNGRKCCKWLTAGRTFRLTDSETPTSLEVFHQAEVFWVDEGLGEQQLLDAVRACASRLVPGPEPVIRDATMEFPFMRMSKEFDFPWQDTVLEVGAGGVGDAELLRRGGLDPERFGSIHFAFGLERCALVKHNLDDARKLWHPPYVK